MKKNKLKGFTLIELMVVISIIGLLSSIVLSSIKDARDKSNGTKFRAEVDQVIKALELYSLDNNGMYPYEDNSSNSNLYRYDIKNNNSETSSDSPSLSVLLNKYIKKMPEVPKNNFAQNNNAITYNSNHKNSTSAIQYRCGTDNIQDNYVISISSASNPQLFSFFSDWENPSLWSSNIMVVSSVPSAKCFSLK